jgi:hypothetical protein
MAKAPSATFPATVELNGKTATGVEVPPHAVEALGPGKRPPVHVTIGSYSYRSTVAVMGGRYLVPLSAEHRSAAGLAAGDAVEVTLTLDDAPRVVEVPSDFAAALAGDAGAAARFEAMSYSHKRRWVLSIESAKSFETRQRRIAKAVADIARG